MYFGLNFDFCNINVSQRHFLYLLNSGAAHVANGTIYNKEDFFVFATTQKAIS